MGNAADVLWQSSVRDTANYKWTTLAEIADVFLHLLRARGTVQPEHINREGLQDRHHRGDVRTHQHGACGFHRHTHHQRPALAGLAERRLNALQRRLDLENILAGFDDQQIHVPGQQAFCLFGKGGLHGVEVDMPQGGQLRGRAHGARHETGLFWGGVAIRHLAGQLGGPLIHGKALVGDVVFRQHQ